MPQTWLRLRDLQLALVLGHVLPNWYTLMMGGGDIEVTRQKMHDELKDHRLPWEM